MASPYGGDRGGGRKSNRKPGAQPGNTNRRGSLYLPRAKDADDRRRFLDAIEQARELPADEMAARVRALMFARVLVLAEGIGVDRLANVLFAIDGSRRTEAKLAGDTLAVRRERLRDDALNQTWEAVKECEHCNGAVDEILSALQLELKQL